MSFLNYYEYIPGEYQDVSREPLSAAGPDPAWFLDTNGVKLAGYNVELWDAVSGGVQLLEGTDYSLVYQDAEKSLSEGQPIWAGYQVITPIYQDVSLYLTIRMIGGYTVYHGDTVTGVIIEDYGDEFQRVIKWDTGLMTVLIYRELEFTITTASGVLFRNDTALDETLITLLEPFAGDGHDLVAISTTASSPFNIIAIRPNYMTTSSIKFLAHSSVSQTINPYVRAEITGRWK